MIVIIQIPKHYQIIQVFYSQCDSTRVSIAIETICLRIKQFTYYIRLALSYFFFMHRTCSVFEGTIVALSKFKKRCLYLLAFLICITMPIGQLISIVYFGVDFSLTRIELVTIVLWTIFYLAAFCYTSYTIAKQLKLCASAVFGKNKILCMFSNCI